ncbi:sulfite exporter TauE/SafE family protein [Corticibacter populi]|uniref:Probable membrane transporter protein n=1 Tax=Corticibacter populi TaxID=1550736 RepID=A0A3M6QM30_9BURK|nr:TSUP family transporter [Corticibacter populi]RMX04133.1 sulfite exporter TauE/SafE family protein [Corticibacter populi]RZS33145.1 hypothetical protein EV687_1464 [Corticibacter populi]
MEWIIVSLASLFAGFVDAIVGGGGLILVPALFAVYPNAAPATLFGTNKTGSIWGTSFSAWKYARRVRFKWIVILPAVAAAFGGSMLGSWAVTVASADILRKALPFVLLGVLVYTLAKKDLGQHHRPLGDTRRELALACAIGLLIGFYDGFFGPGTGSFFVFAFVRLLGYDFLNASANAKLLNIATNLASILLLGFKGYIWWHLTIALALANIAGSLLGTHMALKYGSGFVRWIFVAVVSVLIARTAWDAFLR